MALLPLQRARLLDELLRQPLELLVLGLVPVLIGVLFIC